MVKIDRNDMIIIMANDIAYDPATTIVYSRDLEFLMFDADRNRIVIADMKQTNERLLKSDYYLQRKNDWFDYEVREDKIEGLPIVLTDEENAFRNDIANAFEIVDEGWFDVGKISR